MLLRRVSWFCLAVYALGCLCAVIPGETDVPSGERLPAPRHYYHEPRRPDLSGSALLGIPKLNPLWWAKNSDSPLPDWWLPDEADMARRRRRWYLRNPMHNFTHYVIGVADRHFHRVGGHAAEVWNPGGGANFAVIRCGPWLRLPFVSYRGEHLEFYLGWRDSGNFGMALRHAHAKSGPGAGR